MPMLEKASGPEMTRLLDLFPLASLKATWPKLKDRKKAALSTEVASTKAYPLIRGFIDTYVSCCKQHVYVFEQAETADKPLELPATIIDGAQIDGATPNKAIYLSRVVMEAML